MEKSNTLVKAVVVALVSTALIGGTTSAIAASKYIKCYGIAKKGKNDCGTSKHACAGRATEDNQASDWVYATKPDCVEKGGKPES